MQLHRLALTLATIAPALCATATAEPALTIYNQHFAVVRETVPVDLKAGANELSFTGMTALAEPQSVVFRDPTAAVPFSILAQSYRNDAVSQEAMLNLFEGKTIKFLVSRANREEIIDGKIIRGADANWLAQQRNAYYTDRSNPGGGMGQPIIEVGGELRFGLPGQPIFPKLGDDSILKPALSWKIESERAAKFTAELAYVTGGFQWIADYNLIAPEKGDDVDLIGWVGVTNTSGTTFRDARIRLLAGDVNRLVPDQRGAAGAIEAPGFLRQSKPRGPSVTEKEFDEYHLYTLPQPVTLRDGETVQVEFIRASGVKGQRIYTYDGAQLPNMRDRSGGETLDPRYGTESNPAVWVLQEFRNDEANHLGMPLPRGRIRFYRHDGPQLEFTGENFVQHTAKGETLRVYTGDAFDLTGERNRLDSHRDDPRSSVDESIAIKLRNHKKELVEIRAVEHLFRPGDWEIIEKSNAFVKTDAQTIEFRVQVKPEEEKVITYKVRYIVR